MSLADTHPDVCLVCSKPLSLILFTTCHDHLLDSSLLLTSIKVVIFCTFHTYIPTLFQKDNFSGLYLMLILHQEVSNLREPTNHRPLAVPRHNYPGLKDNHLEKDTETVRRTCAQLGRQGAAALAVVRNWEFAVRCMCARLGR